MARRVGRQRHQLPPCHYEGFLEKRSFKDKTSRKLWTSLCGSTLFFFQSMRDADYVEKLDLKEFISITDDGSLDRNLDAARMILQMKNENIKLTAPNAEARELWKGFIQSVAELDVPSHSLNLLPGQIHMLKEAVEQEKERAKNVLPPVANPAPCAAAPANAPECFYRVSRGEAELLLEREAKNGNLLLRPGSSGNSFAVTTRQDLNGSIFRHYKVTQTDKGGFIIDVEDPVSCATLRDVVHYLVEKTDNTLIPLIVEEAYEKNISFVRVNNENGERSFQRAPSNSVPPAVPPKPVMPIVPALASAPAPDEDIYLNDTLVGKPSKKAMMPPIPVPRKFQCKNSLPSSASYINGKEKAGAAANPALALGQTLSELKIKLEVRQQAQATR